MFRVLLILGVVVPGVRAADYDPLQVAKTAVEHTDFTVKDEKRSRDISIRVYLPASKSAAPVVLFSHGLGGSRENNPYLGRHWAGRGYVVVFMQHAGSDEGVWKDAPLGQRMAAMKKAAGGENLLLRVRDVSAVLDALTAWNEKKGHALAGRLDMKHIGMSGHSFGAVTTQAVSGQTFVLGKGFTDARVKSAVMMSPSVPAAGDAKKAFGKVRIPWLLMTGTNDNSPISDMDAKSRLLVYPALPEGDKYELVLDRAEHSAFSERALPGDTAKRNPNHHRAIKAISTAFWDATLRQDADAKKWLTGKGAEGVLEKADRWQKK